MDRISEVPESIAHRILCALNTPAELVRMSVLPKTWFHLTASFPVLDFNVRMFSSREIFFKYFEYTTSIFCQQNLIAGKFTLSANLEDPRESDIVNRCLELVLNNGVKVLAIDTPTFLSARSMPKYRLPNTLLSVSVLKSLTIRHCELPSSLMVGDVQFKSLIQLVLADVRIDEQVIKHLTTSCPRLQVFYIIHCNGFREFCVHGHQNLQNVRIHYRYNSVDRIDIEAPNLYYLSIEDGHGEKAPQMNLTSCKKLTSVTYGRQILPNSNGFTNFLSKFPFVENLVLVNAYSCNKLKLSSQTLKALVLHSKNVDLANIEFNTPNLGFFIYSFGVWDSWYVARHAHLLQTCMRSYSNGQSIDAVWFRKLKLFLDDRNRTGFLDFYIHTWKFTELAKLKAIEWEPSKVKHIELHIDNHEDNAAFVDAILWCCRPQTLTLRSPSLLTDFEEQSGVVKFTYEKLLQQEVQGHTNIQIVSPASSLLSFSGKARAISFMKEEEAG